MRSSQSSLFIWAKQLQLSQPDFTTEVLRHSDGYCGPPLNPFEQGYVFLMLEASEPNAVLKGIYALFPVLDSAAPLSCDLQVTKSKDFHK